MSKKPEQLDLPGIETPVQAEAIGATEEQMQAWYDAGITGHMGNLQVPQMHENELIVMIGQLMEVVGIQRAALDNFADHQVPTDTPERTAQPQNVHEAVTQLREILNYLPDDKLSRAAELFNKLQEQL